MDVVAQFVAHTPWWVYVLFVYLLSRGLKARKPGDVTLAKLAVIPVLFTVMGLMELSRLYGLSFGSVAPWAAALLVGTAIGWWLLAGVPMTVDRARGVIHRPADFTVLPLILVAFAIKYAFGVIAAVSPETLQEPIWRLAETSAYGLFAGIFAGKFANYASRLLAAPAASSAGR